MRFSYIKMFITAFFCILSLAGLAVKADSEIIYDNCSVIKMSGVKTGYYCQTQRKKTENSKKYIVTDRHFEQGIKRLSNTIQIIQDTTYVEDESGKPVSFHIKSASSGENFEISGKFVSPFLVSADFNINGVKSSKNIKYNDKILFQYAIDSLYRYSDLNKISYSTIEPSMDLRAIKIKTEKLQQESLSVDGLNNKYNKYKVSISILPGISSYEWRDNNGFVVKEAVPLLKMEQVLSNKNDILNIPDEISVDPFEGSLIPVDKTITDPDALDHLSYKIKVFDIPMTNLFLNDDRQKITRQKNNVIYLKIKSIKKQTQQYHYPVDKKGLEEYLKTGPFIMPDSAKISAIAKNIAGGETDTYIIAKKMENWVYKNITNKNLSFDFANAVEALETQTGDCTEHAVLLASLLRAAGIPSKIVVGLIYTDVPKNSFGYHMWVKAYIGKNQSKVSQWLDFDATLPYKNFVPTHIAMMESPLNNISDRTDLLINILKSFSGIKIEILNDDKSTISKLNDGILKINFGKADNNDFLTIKTLNNKVTASETDTPGIKNISLNGADEKDYMRTAYYNFIKGNIQESYDNFNVFYNSVAEYDDFSNIRLGLKLSELGFFNLAGKAFDNVKDRNIWGLQINNIKTIYFPKKKLSLSDEMTICRALSKIKFQNLSDEGISLINKEKNRFQTYDYAHYLLAKAYMANNKANAALNELKKAVKLNPENLSYRMEQAKIYIQTNSYKSAERELSLTKEMAEKAKIGDTAFWKEFNEQNIWLKFKSERMNPLKSKYYKAKYYEAKNEYNVALDILNEIAKGNPDKADIFNALGNIYLKKSQPDIAKQNFTKALMHEEKNVTALKGLGAIYFSEGNIKSALEKYNKAFELEPDNIELKLKIAEIYEISGQEEKSDNYYNEVMQNPSLCLKDNYNIGMMYLRAGDAEEAEKMLIKALSSDPMHSLIWVDVAGIEITKRNYTLAENYLKPVAYIDEKNPYYYYYMGLINKIQGNFDVARQNFDKAIELKPDFDEVNQVLKRL